MKIINLLGILTICICSAAACTQSKIVSQNSSNETNIFQKAQEDNNAQNGKTVQNSPDSDGNNSAQAERNLVITSNKVVYKRPNAEMESKKTFEVDYPKVKAATPELSKKIEDLLSYEKAFPGLNIKEQIAEEEYLSTAGYEVNYNKNNILDISLWYEGVGAYSSTFTKNLVIDAKNGVRVKPSDVFTNLAELAAKVRKAQLEEIEKSKAEYKKDADSADFSGDEYFNKSKFTEIELNNFTVSDKGVTFNYNYEFPHAVLALQPEGKYFYGWSELKPFIRRDGLLGKFIR